MLAMNGHNQWFESNHARWHAYSLVTSPPAGSVHGTKAVPRPRRRLPRIANTHQHLAAATPWNTNIYNQRVMLDRLKQVGEKTFEPGSMEKSLARITSGATTRPWALSSLAPRFACFNRAAFSTLASQLPLTIFKWRWRGNPS
jgi:hypothetical protein